MFLPWITLWLLVAQVGVELMWGLVLLGAAEQVVFVLAQVFLLLAEVLTQLQLVLAGLGLLQERQQETTVVILFFLQLLP
jgi:hypothetical protein